MTGLGFPTTHWTLIVRAQGSETEKRQATEEIASNYRLPLLRYARARGLSTDRAEDLVQSLFVKLLSSDFVARLDPERGRLRRGCFVAVPTVVLLGMTRVMNWQGNTRVIGY